MNMTEMTPEAPPPPPPPTSTDIPGPSANIPASPVGQIADDIFWLKYAKDSIEGAKKACDDGAMNLLKVINWIWPIYTATFTVTSIYFSDKLPCTSRVLLGFPILFIFLGYWFAQNSLLPIFTKFDPRIPYEIRQQYNYVMDRRKTRITWATVCCLLAVVSLSFGLFFIRAKGYDTAKTPTVNVPNSNSK
jgi:lipopolysaccharide export LptBFGC system permease protein LptF